MVQSLTPLTPLTTSNVASVPKAASTSQAAPKVTRSYSVSSNISSNSNTSSAYSRAADDMLDRLASMLPDAMVHLWSAGNVRLHCGRDLTIPAHDAMDLIDIMQNDERFSFVELKHFGEDGDWKISFKRTTSPLATPIPSDSE